MGEYADDAIERQMFPFDRPGRRRTVLGDQFCEVVREYRAEQHQKAVDAAIDELPALDAEED